MAAIAWEHLEDSTGRRVRRAPLQLVTSPPSRRRPNAEVYRRRRLVALALAAVLVVGAFQLLSATLGASASAGTTWTGPAVVVAEAGDSYWSLASEVHEGGDIRSTVDALVAANGGHSLRPGDRIVLPD